ncbi:alpha-amylase family glycosyl hydrolase [Thermophagus sp. OGC60D27]|uniref:alpha-amylase family glycosyl hydrolase n=1 Tax=Thermophagus sp. OGC60D27 TaxID=3458415 RepID=UPI004037B1CB
MKSKSLTFLLLIFLTCSCALSAIDPIERIDPPFWWTGMKNNKLQLMIYGQDISHRSVTIHYPGVRLDSIHQVDNANYLFLDITIGAETPAGTMPIKAGNNIFNYPLYPKPNEERRNQGIGPEDLIYLIMPDRFANGNPQNDIISSMEETSICRDSMYYRHGGDLQGIINHLDYISELGVTAIWCTPEVENNQPVTSYHGYSVTDHYKIDPRLGTNQLYQKYVNLCHQKGLKVIKDVVLNHIGSKHWMVKDLPMSDWLNDPEQHPQSTYNCDPIMDPYGSEKDRLITLKGWIHHSMPDLNTQNKYVQKYLTQNTIWWLTYAGIDGIRFDTYFYNDPEFLTQWASQVKEEFPSVTIFAETWVNGIVKQAFFNGGNTVNRDLDTQIDGITDFQLREAILTMVNKIPQEWKNILTPNIFMNPVYATLAADFVYKSPSYNLAFLDNHDLSRIFSVVGEDVRKLKTALTILLTTNRIPQIYYGTEIGMTGFCNPDGLVRSDFPGGWPNDMENKFTKEGRTTLENEIFHFTKKLANYRKNSDALKSGKMMQFFPMNNIYVYFRYTNNQIVMVVVNSNDHDVYINANDYTERTNAVSVAQNVITGEKINNLKRIPVPAYEAVVFQLE